MRRTVTATKKIPLQLIDYPVDNPRTTSKAVGLLARELKRLVANIVQITGRPIHDNDLTEEIRRFNKIRRLAREFDEIWQSADVPPTNSTDFRHFTSAANDPAGDVTATICLLEQAVAEIKDRVSRGVRGKGLTEDPARVYVCGSCVSANPTLIDNSGGVLAGHDDQWSAITIEVAEEGDPYINLATAILSQPYEKPTRERALWTAAEVKRTRSAGLIYVYNWGCQYQSNVGRMIADIVKEETGVPTLVMGISELSRSEATEQSQNRIEAFIEILKYNR
ncbi:MAG TPA: 2-hydroxyacyl-CoA dehydratase family protein [Bacillota bacterium]|nr:2-hydroxyacyl-CoA dehydratase family protein [Bacillota bacterium]